MKRRQTAACMRPLWALPAAIILLAAGEMTTSPTAAEARPAQEARADTSIRIPLPADREHSPDRQGEGAEPSRSGGDKKGDEGQEQAPLVPMTVTVVRALDKITARSRLIELPEGRPVRFGTLEILARHCESRPPEEEPETAAFLEIWDNRGGRHDKIFSGWMLASSPALHALEHPVYDLWVIACKTAAPDASSGRR